MEHRECRICGNSLEGLHPLRLYCSKLCKSRAGEKLKLTRMKPRPCIMCGKVFMPRRYRNEVCSKECVGRRISLGKIGRKNPNWKGVRDGRVDWDATLGPSCEICGSDNQLRLHHIIYRQHVRKLGGGLWDPRNGMTLCMSCHSRHHIGVNFRVSVRDLPAKFFAFGGEMLGDHLWDYFARHYDDGNPALEGLLSDA